FSLAMPGTRPSEWMSDTFPGGIAADQPGGDVARLLELAQRLVVGGRNGQPPVRMHLVLDLAVAVGPFPAAANNNGRCPHQLVELGECLPGVLVAVDCQDHALREVGLFGAVAVPEAAMGGQKTTGRGVCAARRASSVATSTMKLSPPVSAAGVMRNGFSWSSKNDRMET